MDDRFHNTLYDALGVSRDASPDDIQRAWKRHRAQQRSETTPPDPRGEALIRHAYETLSDPYRRDAYDASLRRQSPVVMATKRAPRKVAAVALVTVAAFAALGWYLLGEPGKTRGEARKVLKSADEVRDSLVRGVGRVKLVDMAGNETLLGIAVTIDDGVMATPCAGLSPTALPKIVSPKQSWPARVAAYDPIGICRLEVSGGARFPFVLTADPPKPGAKVYTAEVSPNGAPQMVEAKVTRLSGGGMMATVPVGLADGRPLLDEDGRLAAIGVRDDSGGGRYIPVPRSWLAREALPEVSRPVVREAPPPADGTARKPPVDISPERAKRLNDAFQPPPKVPDDL